jgi:uracil-DNA glycosylase family 4
MPWPAGRNYVSDCCKHYPRGVPQESEASHIAECDAQAMLVGEAPGRDENSKRIPFVGQAGRLQELELWQPNGLARRDFYLTNVLHYKPPGNKFEVVYSVKGHLEARTAELRTKTAAFQGAVIVPTGNNALASLTGRRGIFKWRGSVLVGEVAGRSTLIIPTIHPAAALRQSILKKTMRHDWARIAEVMRNGWQNPTISLVGTTWNNRALLKLRDVKVLSVDIETVRETSKILCISFCADGVTSYSVDCRNGIAPIVRELLASQIPKVMQNGSFDCYILKLNGVEVRNFIWDTSLMHHALDNNVGPQASGSSGKSTLKPYSLAYMASIYTPFPYWKDSAKDDGTGENYGAFKSNWQRFQEYNAMDALGTFWIARRLLHRLRDTNHLEWYKQQYAALIEPLLQLSLHGVRFDLDGAKRRSAQLEESLSNLRSEIQTLAGQPLHGTKTFKREPKVKEGRADGLAITCREGVWIGEKKSLSNKQLHAYLYKQLKLKVQYHVDKSSGKKAISADEVALRNLLLFVKEDAKWKGNRDLTTSVLNAILTFRETEKTLQFLNAKNVDDDGRLRCAYSQLVQTGRLRSYSNPLGTGMNLQNIQRNVRHFFLPDNDNEYFLEIDLKQAEDLVVKAMSSAATQDQRPLALVQAVWDSSVDIHKRLASAVFAVPEAQVTYEQRYCAKKCRHARNNDMHEGRMQQMLLKDGFVYTKMQCKAILAAIDEAEPWVLGFHRAVRDAINRHNCVATSWGWQLRFEDERRTDSSTFRRGYAFIQQSEIGVMMKQWGLLTYANDIAPRFKARLNMLVHDNVVLSVPQEELYDVASVLYRSLTRPRLYSVRSNPTEAGTVEIAIPAEIKISKALSCTCEDCKVNRKPLEFSGLVDRPTFERRFAEWQQKNATT